MTIAFNNALFQIKGLRNDTFSYIDHYTSTLMPAVTVASPTRALTVGRIFDALEVHGGTCTRGA